MSYGHLAQKAKLAGEKPPQRSLRSKTKITTTLKDQDTASRGTGTLPSTVNISSEASNSKPHASTASENDRTISTREKHLPSIILKIPQQQPIEAPKEGPPAGPPSKMRKTVKFAVETATEPDIAAMDGGGARRVAITGNPTVWTAGVPAVVDTNILIWYVEEGDAAERKVAQTEIGGAAIFPDTVYCSGRPRRKGRSKKAEVKLFETVLVSKPPRFGAGIAEPKCSTCPRGGGAVTTDIKRVDSSGCDETGGPALVAAQQEASNVTVRNQEAHKETSEVEDGAHNLGQAETNAKDNDSKPTSNTKETKNADTITPKVYGDQEDHLPNNRPLGGIRKLLDLRSAGDEATLHRMALRCASRTRGVDIFDNKGPAALIPRSPVFGGATEHEVRRKKRAREEEVKEKQEAGMAKKMKVANGVKEVLSTIDRVAETHSAERHARQQHE